MYFLNFVNGFIHLYLGELKIMSAGLSQKNLCKHECMGFQRFRNMFLKHIISEFNTGTDGYEV